MNNYEKDEFEHLILLIRTGKKEHREWLLENNCRELVEFWDACEGDEPAFKWLLENHHRPLAAAVDAMFANDKAKAWLLTSGNRELAAFVDACDGAATAVTWLMKTGNKGWVMVAKEIHEKDKKKNGSFIWTFLNFGNPFR
ncbi:MAG: hypothetical protein IT242_04875 [Bacteroidia bacterium]|nr:hypothetical protein [Bacteroidia bacterium]